MAHLNRRRRRPAATLVVVALCLVVTACGSQLDPDTVAGAAGTDSGTVNGVVTPGEPVDADGDGLVDPGVDPGADPDASADVGPGVDSSAPPGTDPGTPVTSDGPDVTPEENEPTGDGPAGDCDGFKNTTGITDDTITIANASDISGPVPGLFEASQQGVKAFVTYYNATEKLCGRSLELMNLDSRSDAGGDQQAYTKACAGAFAVVGSTSSQDAGGAATAQSCGIPDIRAFTVTPDRQNCSTCFSAYTVSTGQIAASLPKYYLQEQPDASQHVAILYADVDAARVNSESFAAGYEKAGMNVDLVQGIGVSEFNFAPYVQQMKDKDIDFVQYFGPYQFAIKLQQAMAQASFDPAVYLEDPTIYDSNYVEQSDGIGDGSEVYSPIQLLDNTKIPEMALYRAWLDQVAPGAVPNYYGLFAWSAARLFVEQATALGGKLSRASLVAELKKVKDWTGNGIHAPMAIGAKTTSPCIKILQLDGSTFKQVSPGDFMCGALIETGVN